MKCVRQARKFWKRCMSRVIATRQVLTRDFNYSTDHFFGLDLMMALCGARWNTPEGKLRSLWKIHRVLVYFPVVVIMWNTFQNIKCDENLEIVLSSVQGAVGVGVGVLRNGIIIWHYDLLMNVRRYINRRNFGRNLQQAFGIRSESFYHIRKIVMCVNSTLILLFISIPMIDNSHHHLYKMPGQNVGQNASLLQYCGEKALNVLIIAIVIMNFIAYLLPYMILSGLESEVKVIAQSVSAIFDNIDQRLQLKLESEPGSSHQLAAKKKFYFWKYLQEELSECIELNIQFLNTKNRIQPLLNSSFFVIYFSAALIMSCGAIYITQMTTLTLFSVQTLYYVLWVACECASVTRMVSLLNEANETIGWQVYCLDWPARLEWDEQFQHEYRSVRQAMTTVMAVSQQPLRLTCFGTFEFAQEQFWELLNMAYNLYTFFRDFV